MANGIQRRNQAEKLAGSKAESEGVRGSYKRNIRILNNPVSMPSLNIVATV